MSTTEELAGRANGLADMLQNDDSGRIAGVMQVLEDVRGQIGAVMEALEERCDEMAALSGALTVTEAAGIVRGAVDSLREMLEPLAPDRLEDAIGQAHTAADKLREYAGRVMS